MPKVFAMYLYYIYKYLQILCLQIPSSVLLKKLVLLLKLEISLDTVGTGTGRDVS